MTSEEAVANAALLASMTTGWDDDSIEAYAWEFKTWDDGAMLERAIRTVVRSWDRQGRPPMGVVMDAYSHEGVKARYASNEKLAAAGVIRCGGTLWVYEGDRHVPCPTCSPALYRVWKEGDLLERYRQGTSLFTLLSDGNDDEFRAKYQRPACRPFEAYERPMDQGEREVGPAEGKKVAAAAYANDCALRGVEPSWEKWNHSMRATGL